MSSFEERENSLWVSSILEEENPFEKTMEGQMFLALAEGYHPGDDLKKIVAPRQLERIYPVAKQYLENKKGDNSYDPLNYFAQSVVEEYENIFS